MNRNAKSDWPTNTSDPIDGHRNISKPTVSQLKRGLEGRARKLREEERLARKRSDDENAEEYRKAANAIENAIAELEVYL